MGSTDRTSKGQVSCWILALVAAALGILPVACGRDGDAATEDAAVREGEVDSQLADTVAIPPRTDLDDPGPVDGLVEADPAAEVARGDTAGQLSDTAGRPTAGDGTGLPERPVQLRVPAGTRVRLTSETDISTDVYEVGDPVIATLVQDVMDGMGEVVIAQGTYFLGRVEASAGSGGIGEPPVLEVAFETLSAWNYERPIESVVVDVAVTLDPEADRARRSARGRDAMSVVPGRITTGTIIVVQLREPVFVPPLDPLAFPLDSMATEDLPDTVSQADTVLQPNR